MALMTDHDAPILPAHREAVRAIAELHAQHHRQATAVDLLPFPPADLQPCRPGSGSDVGAGRTQAVPDAIMDTHEALEHDVGAPSQPDARGG
jgi:hypothetical protein